MQMGTRQSQQLWVATRRVQENRKKLCGQQITRKIAPYINEGKGVT